MEANLLKVLAVYQPLPSHDDKLFLAQLFIGTYCLMRLSELVWPNNSALQSYHKITMHHSVQVSPEALSFWLPGHKGDQFFKGNRLFMQASAKNPFHLFLSYLTSHDSIFRARPELWLCSNGMIPTWYWFIGCLHHLFPMSIARQSMCAGGATALTEARTPPNLIQAAGRWSLDTFNRYI